MLSKNHIPYGKNEVFASKSDDILEFLLLQEIGN